MKKTIGVIGIALTLCCSVLTGCSGPDAASIKTTVTSPPAHTASALGPDVQNKIRNSQLKFHLSGVNGKKGTLYLFAEDEKVHTATAPSCYSNTGDSVRSGDYALYFEQAAGSSLEKQDVPLFPDATLEFNDNRPQYQLYTDPQKQWPDLLVLEQTMACTGDQIALFALAPDGKRVQQIHFQSSGVSTSKTTIVAKEVERLAPDQFRTSVYDNSKGAYRITTWKWLPDQNVWVEQNSAN